MPRSVQLTGQRQTLISVPHSGVGRRQVRQIGGQAWRARLSYPPLERADFAALMAFLAKQRGQYGTFTVSAALLGLGTPRGTATGSPVVRNRQNLLLYSDDFSNAAWAKNGTIAQGTSAASASPDGTDMQEWHATGTGTSISVARAVGTFADDNVLSVYVKAGTATTSVLNLYDQTAVANHQIGITWSGGVPTLGTATAIDDYGLESVGGGVYRLWLYLDAATRSIVGNGRAAYFYPRGVNTELTGCYLWRMQLEEGVVEPGYRLQTTSAAVTNEAQDAGASTIYTAGWTPSLTYALRAGDLLKFADGSKVYMVLEEAPSDASGNAALAIEPELVDNLTNGGALTVSSVPFTMGLGTDLAELSLGRLLFGGIEVDLVETY